MRILKVVAMALSLAAPGMAMAADTGNIIVNLEVTAPQQPTVSISELDNVSFATLDVAALNTTGSIGAIDVFCVSFNNPSSFPISPTIAFSQPNVTAYRPEISTHDFVLVGPNRADGIEAQLPITLAFGTSGNFQTSISRTNVFNYLVNAGPDCAGGGGSYNVPGTAGQTPKPTLTISRNPSANNLNPAGHYTATILVTVTPN